MQNAQEIQKERNLPFSMVGASTATTLNQGWITFLDENGIDNQSIANPHTSAFTEIFRYLLEFNELNEFERVGKEAIPAMVEKKLKVLSDSIKADIAEHEAKEKTKIDLRADGFTKGAKLIQSSKLSEKVAELRMIFNELNEIETEHKIQLINMHSGATLRANLNRDDSLLFFQGEEWRCNL